MPCDDHTAAMLCGYIETLDGVKDASIDTKQIQHLPQQMMRYSVERFLKIHKTAIQLASRSLLPFLSLCVSY